MIFGYESRICIGQCGDSANLVWCRCNKTYKEDFLKKTRKFPKTFTIRGSMSFKWPGKTAFITSKINAYVYIEIPDNFLIPSRENWLGDDEIIFQADNVSCHRANAIKVFLRERHSESMTWTGKCLDLNPIENLPLKFKKWPM